MIDNPTPKSTDVKMRRDAAGVGESNIGEALRLGHPSALVRLTDPRYPPAVDWLAEEHPIPYELIETLIATTRAVLGAASPSERQRREWEQALLNIVERPPTYFIAHTSRPLPVQALDALRDVGTIRAIPRLLAIRECATSTLRELIDDALKAIRLRSPTGALSLSVNADEPGGLALSTFDGENDDI